MQIEIVQNNRILKTYRHKGQIYAEVPKSGPYKIRIRNSSHKQRMAVVSVDGVNVITGEDAGFDGDGYVLRPYETLEIPGFRRDDGTVAAFTMEEKEKSYAAQTGRGTSNVGVIGVAIFNEKVKVQAPFVIRENHHHYYPPQSQWTEHIGTRTIFTHTDDTDLTNGIQEYSCDSVSVDDAGDLPVTTTFCMTSSPVEAEPTKSGGVLRGAAVKDVGTAYGEKVEFHTMDCEFEKATDKPAKVFQIRYATRERLKEWGVPVDQKVTKSAPNPFPASSGASVPAPPGWEG